ncbi:LOW QUALITY PROTEIN: hypothetical protein U9M48_044025 [Paspalum notatum var. saurae]|uniref:Uncharacterized protein n=1 Tax=Paspalum notatum var. saurae TaxID=547442 RepID=A0AAQ3UU63_PASNO
MEYVNPLTGFRVDGRRPNEMRQLKGEVGVVARADGSALFEMGNTRVIAAVYGPREIQNRGQQVNSNEALVRCEYRMAEFSTGDRRRKPKGDRRSTEISLVIRQTMEASILTHLMPRSQIDIFVQVLQADGGTRSACINAATLALADAGIPMRDIVTSCSAGYLCSTPLLDLNYIEDSAGGPDVTVGILTKMDKVTLLQPKHLLLISFPAAIPSLPASSRTRRVRTARDVVFDEGRGWAWDKAVDDGSTPTYDDFTVEYIHFERGGGSRQLLFTEHAYPGPRASTDSGVTLSGHDFGRTKFFTNTTAAPATPRTSAPTLDSTLKGMGFEQSPHEAAIYRRGNGGNAWPVGVYVDDLVITGVKDAEVAAFKEETKATFRMSDTGPLSFYPGIEVHRDDSGITLRQTAYAKRVVELAGLTDRNPALTPMEERAKPSRDGTTEEVDATRCRRLVGSLRYLVHTRPDLAFSVGYSVHAATDDGAPTSREEDHPLCCGDSRPRPLLPEVPGEAHLVGYDDGDHGGDIDTGKSTSGILFFLGKCLVGRRSMDAKLPMDTFENVMDLAIEGCKAIATYIREVLLENTKRLECQRG